MKKTKEIAIRLTGINKRYTIHHEKPTMVEKLVFKKNETFFALKNINITIKKGERIGIIGSNGSGKTTLLKIMAGITSPTKGQSLINGRVVSLIDLEAGFHPDLTGVQNIYLNGMLLGMDKIEISDKMKTIIAFAGIGKFIDSPLFTYSQGMKLRLGFSIATHSNSEIILLDENISVGDIDFKAKSIRKFKELVEQQKTIIIASHDLNFIKNNCDRAIWIDSGRIICEGSIATVIKKYSSAT